MTQAGFWANFNSNHTWSIPSSCLAHRNRLQSFTKASLLPRNLQHCALEDTTNIGPDKGCSPGQDKWSLNKTKQKKKSANIQQKRSGAASPRHIQDHLASYRLRQLTIIITIRNTRTLKVTKTLVTAGISRGCLWKARFYLSGKNSTWEREGTRINKGAVSSVRRVGNEMESKQPLKRWIPVPNRRH